MRKHTLGFTLVEVAISMVILGLVLAGLVVALSQQLQQSYLLNTRTALNQANEALLAFVVANARLPCPAVVGSNGLESTNGVGQCTAAAGFLPAVTLGLPNLDRYGLLEDGWADGSIRDDSGALSYPRAIRYSVALLLGTPQPYALVTASLGGAARSTVGTALAANNGLFVCRSSIGLAGAGNRCGNAANSLALNAVAVVWSQGVTGNDAIGNSADETQNASQLGAPGIARAFVMRDPADTGSPVGRFDDVVTWLAWGPVADKLMLAWQIQ
ncbi:MAG TPA: type II secretion system protein [Steroidobacteraceae bacterium]|nr:type II secretion system protein [Steroidobacteraceae bacterium]